jgi:ABC-type antimicrobial peptide transport system ATPase subunit
MHVHAAVAYIFKIIQRIRMRWHKDYMVAVSHEIRDGTCMNVMPSAGRSRK